MALKETWNKLIGLFNREEDDEIETFGPEEGDDGWEPETSPVPAPNSSRQAMPAYRSGASAAPASVQSGKPYQMIVVEPETFDECKNIADNLRKRCPVVINFEKADDDIAKRIVDFVSGVTYALDGSMQKVGRDIFLCVPSNVSVNKESHGYTEFSAEPLVWKERE